MNNEIIWKGGPQKNSQMSHAVSSRKENPTPIQQSMWETGTLDRELADRIADYETDEVLNFTAGSLATLYFVFLRTPSAKRWCNRVSGIHSWILASNLQFRLLHFVFAAADYVKVNTTCHGTDDDRTQGQNTVDTGRFWFETQLGNKDLASTILAQLSTGVKWGAPNVLNSLWLVLIMSPLTGTDPPFRSVDIRCSMWPLRYWQVEIPLAERKISRVFNLACHSCELSEEVVKILGSP